MPEEKAKEATKEQGSFKGTIKDISHFVSGIASIVELIDEGTFMLKPEGMKLLATDKAMVSVVDFEYKRAAFQDYETKGDPKISLNLTQMVNILKRFTGTVTLSSEGQKLHIASADKSYDLPLIDMGNEEVPPVENLKFAGDLTVSYDLLRDIIEDAKVISDSIVFLIKPNEVKIHADSELNSYEKIIPRDKMELSADWNAKARFSLDYMDKMTKSHVADKIKLSLAQDHPLRLFAENDEAKLVWIVAPRVEEEGG
jgi:DNA polymerase III sliding clamp (beta) subunit (PCNA family)